MLGVNSGLKLNVLKETLKPIVELKKLKLIEHPLRGFSVMNLHLPNLQYKITLQITNRF